jgi:hypothetical protein
MLWFVSFLISIVVTIARGFLIKLFYGWFILSHWTTLPQLNVAACLGLSYFLYSISSWNFGDLNKDSDEATIAFLKINIMSLVYIVMLFVFGFITHSFM